ncbi:hypothetical protein LAZ67_4003245 [Cordylochernes scorpioides]|uniref:Uncharacterized protein n=1 Tax=Cordylochernes scorpioides TaxID=51811 RepID=A0ABY6KGW8_9ARAC|nr:hypothetical protein LAZ67_4003245 [Cordylochernes scorpioides]
MAPKRALSIVEAIEAKQRRIEQQRQRRLNSPVRERHNEQQWQYRMNMSENQRALQRENSRLRMQRIRQGDNLPLPTETCFEEDQIPLHFCGQLDQVCPKCRAKYFELEQTTYKSKSSPEVSQRPFRDQFLVIPPKAKSTYPFQVSPSLLSQPNRHLDSFFKFLHFESPKLNLDSQVLKLAKYKSLDIADKFKITYNAVKEIDGMLVSINRILDGIKQDKSTSEEFSIKLPKFQLPIFSGNFSEWLGFKEIFIKVIDQNRSLANYQKLQYLVSALRGDAARLVGAFSISDENYSIAWQKP